MEALIHDNPHCPKFGRADTVQKCDTCWSLWWAYWERVDEDGE